MLPVVILDVHESDELGEKLERTLTVIRQPLEPQGFADIMWEGNDGQYTWERKQAPEFTAAIHSKLETQLKKYLLSHPGVNVILGIEGIYSPISGFGGGTRTWKKKNTLFTPYRKTPVDYTVFQAWLWSIRRFGVDVIQTLDLDSTAQSISAVVYQTLKSEDEHGVMKRQIKPLVKPTEPDPILESFMGIRKAGIGQVTAKKLKDAGIDTIFRLCTVDYDDLIDTVGQRTADNILGAIGRNP